MEDHAERTARFEREAVPYLQEIYAFANRLTRNPAKAEDLSQDTFLRAYRFFHRYQPGSNLRAWLYKICRNTFINQYHKDTRRPSTVDFDAIEGSFESVLQESNLIARDTPEEAIWRSLLTEEVERCMEKLPPEYSSVIHLVLVKEFSYKEAAEILDVPLGTIMSRLHRGRKGLQKLLLKYAADARLEAAAALHSRVQAREERKPTAIGRRTALFLSNPASLLQT